MSEVLELTVVGLAGNVVAELCLEPEQQNTVGVKRLIHEAAPAALPRWQRLLVGGRLLEDSDSLASVTADPAVASGAGGAPPRLVVQLVVSAEPRDLVQKDPHVVAQAALAFEALAAGAAPHVARLFESDAGVPVQPAAAEQTLFTITQRLAWVRDLGNLDQVKAVLLPHAMDILQSGLLEEHRRQDRLAGIFAFLGPVAVPRLLAWLGLMARPVPREARWRVEQLQRAALSARVRVAAKTALADAGGGHKARVKELAALRDSLGRFAAAAAGAPEKHSLQELRARAVETLRSLAEAGDPHVRYAAEHALKAH